MIFGRPTNLWLALVTSAAGLAQVLIITLRPELDPVAVATILGSTTAFLGVVISVIANQPPTISSGDQVNVVTPQGEPNKTVTVH